jgi:hypothetical protein
VTVDAATWADVADAIEEALSQAPKAVRRGKAGGMLIDGAARRERTDIFLQALRRRGVLVHPDKGECYASPRERRTAP